MTNIDIKYYKQYVDTFGDIDITFDSIRYGEIRYKGEFKDGIILHAIGKSPYTCIKDLNVIIGEKIKVYDFSPDKIRLVKNNKALHEFIVDELYMLDARKGIGFTDDKDGLAVIRVTYDFDSIFALKYVERHPLSTLHQIPERFAYALKSLESELEKEILKGNGDRYKIATYDRPDSEMLHHNNLHALAINADVQTASDSE